MQNVINFKGFKANEKQFKSTQNPDCCESIKQKTFKGINFNSNLKNNRFYFKIYYI